MPLAEAAGLTLEASERLLLDWLHLVKLQALETIRGGAVAFACLTTAGAFVAIAWGAAMVALALALRRLLPADAAIAAVAALNAGLAGAALVVARRWLARRKARP